MKPVHCAWLHPLTFALVLLHLLRAQSRGKAVSVCMRKAAQCDRLAICKWLRGHPDYQHENADYEQLLTESDPG
jgi:hypothetical protein